ncbi:MAG: putative holin-like toxin [Butyricicoccaceae bacterium]
MSYVTYSELFQLLSMLFGFGCMLIALIALFHQNKKK